RVFLVDSGKFNQATQSYDIPPRVYRVDETNTNPGTNGVVVNESLDLVTPLSAAAVAVPVPASIAPTVIAAPTTCVLRGDGMHPGLGFDFGPNLAVSNVTVAGGFPLETAVAMTLTPAGGTGIVPPGCPGGSTASLTVTNPFGGSGTLSGAVQVGDTGGIVPGPPCSRFGDANCDGVVDGLDLGLLGRAYVAHYCDGLRFINNADFDDNDIIDGAD